MVDVGAGVRRIAAKCAGDGGGSDSLSHGAELAGLGILAAPSAVEAYHNHYGTHPHPKGVGGWLTGHGKPITELAGLGVMAIPAIHHFATRPRQPTQ